MADNIPNLAKQDPKHFGVAVCSVDGQRCLFGESEQVRRQRSLFGESE